MKKKDRLDKIIIEKIRVEPFQLKNAGKSTVKINGINWDYCREMEKRRAKKILKNAFANEEKLLDKIYKISHLLGGKEEIVPRQTSKIIPQ